jgi:hypothetical protein
MCFGVILITERFFADGKFVSTSCEQKGEEMFGLGRFGVIWFWMNAHLLMLLNGRWSAQSEAIPVLAYHCFDSAVSRPTTIKTSPFESQLAWLDDHHYQVLPLRSVIERLGRHGDQFPAAPTVAITVDDGHRSVNTEMFR